MTGRMMSVALHVPMLAIAALIASCSDFHAKEEQGGETHFLMECSEDTACAAGLECVCGVCTKACVGTTACAELGDEVACLDLAQPSLLCEGEVPATRICDERCERDADCGARGDEFECVESRCRPEQVASQIAAGGGDAAIPEGPVDPLLFVVLDTSGSMERLADCTCTTLSCNECLPDCSEPEPGRSRWTHAIEALTGTYQDFVCESHDRNEVGSYDREYQLPYHEPMGTQAADGVIDLFRDRVRFGVATFDSIASYDRDEQRSLAEFDFARSQAEAGLWSYPQSAGLVTRPDGSIRGHLRYPGGPHEYWMDTGIRSASADHGALIAAIDPATADETANAIESSLLRTRPYGGTPIAAALDDLYWYFANDPQTAPERAQLERKRHVVLITDGRPDDDYRTVNCGCSEPDATTSCDDFLAPSESADDMVCPYPTPERAARNLRCGFAPECDEGVVSDVYVIGLAVSDDPIANERIEAIAEEGGTAPFFASNREQLRSALTMIIDDITAEPPPSTGESCTVDQAPDLVYADGATWQQACNRCDCASGQVTCTLIECVDCEDDSDCGDSEACYFNWLSCDTGECGPAVPSNCDGPINSEEMCTCDGRSVSSLDCEAMIRGVADLGPCDG